MEDDPPFARTVRRLLAPPFDVIVAGSFAEASAAVEADSYDLYLLDLHLGDGHASDLYEKLDEATKRRVVVLTGGAFTEHDRAFLRTVLNPPLLKPFQRERLHEVLSALLGSAAATIPP